MKDQSKREELIKLHETMRAHLYHIIDGLTQELLLKEISDENNYPHLLSIIWHIGGAETYWFHRANHDIAPKFAIESYEEIKTKLLMNSSGIRQVLQSCSKEQLHIIPPSKESGPSVAWCLLRTYQHGLYHTAQIAKIRHMIGAPQIAEKPDTWNSAVDSVIELLGKLWNVK